MNLPITGPILVTKVKQFALLIIYVDFQPGGGWVQPFKERHSIVYKANTSEGVSLDVEATQKWVEEMLPRILDNCVDTDVWVSDIKSPAVVSSPIQRLHSYVIKTPKGVVQHNRIHRVPTCPRSAAPVEATGKEKKASPSASRPEPTLSMRVAPSSSANPQTVQEPSGCVFCYGQTIHVTRRVDL
ncbi:hypothetical protein HPB49_006745 [Dermacentor silvarum]|uniref:Uncharacterized protein n=1 Tax=Dermacentor silvarum TaxID=543639 RepID=A0ACB8DWH3_DERSI|nr:hypothetical protein HPB49_006745 [Dermacentor silvarum]